MTAAKGMSVPQRNEQRPQHVRHFCPTASTLAIKSENKAVEMVSVTWAPPPGRALAAILSHQRGELVKEFQGLPARYGGQQYCDLPKT